MMLAAALSTAQTRAAIALDIGGTKILSGLVGADGTVLDEARRPTRRSELVADLIASASDMQRRAADLGVQVSGIGVGMTGFIDRESGVLTRSINLGLHDLPLGPALQEACRLPAYVDNDVHAAALGELLFGAGTRYRDFLFFNAGTGIATGLIFNGRLHRGASNAAGDNGHASLDQSGRWACSCGLSGCLEDFILRRRAGEDVPSAHLAGVEPPPLPEYGYVALGIIHLVNLVNPPAVVLAGGMLTQNPEAADWVREAVRRHALPMAVEGLKEMPLAHAGTSAGLVGAGALVFEAETHQADQAPWPRSPSNNPERSRIAR